MERTGFELSAPFLVCQATAKCSTMRLRDAFGFVATGVSPADGTGIDLGVSTKYDVRDRWREVALLRDHFSEGCSFDEPYSNSKSDIHADAHA